MVWAAMALSSLIFVSGCVTSQQTLDEINSQQNDIDRCLGMAIARCNGDAACVKDAKDFYIQLNEDLENLKTLVLEQSWQDARAER